MVQPGPDPDNYPPIDPDEPMPDDPVTSMREIYRWYHDRLLGPASDHNDIDVMSAAELQVSFVNLAETLTHATRQAEMQLAASEAGPTASVSDRLVFRMKATARDLAAIAAKQGAGTPLTAREIAILRKAWEIGTDEVVLQPTVALDGDVIFRVDSRYSTEAKRMLFELHDQSVSVAMRTWKDVVGAAVDLMTNLFKRAAA
jgi:hypothetical protein